MKLFTQQEELRMRVRTCVRGALFGTVAIIAVAWSPLAGAGEANQRPDPWSVKEVMIPMRDGVKLHTKIFVPTDQRGKLPILFERTPYGWDDRNPQTFVPNIFEAKNADFQVAAHRIYRSSKYPSHVSIPVVTRPLQ